MLNGKLLPLATMGVLTLAIFSYPQLRLLDVNEPNVSKHINFARQIDETGDIYPGHFLYHGLVVVAHDLFPVSWFQAHLFIILGVQAALAAVLWGRIRYALSSRRADRVPFVPTAGALGLMVASAASFVTWNFGNYYLGYLVPNVFVSQTYILLQPLALLTFMAAVPVLRSAERVPSPGVVIRLGIFAVLSTLAKPSFVICFFPALFLMVVWRYRWRAVRRLAIIGGFVVVPVLAVIAWQYTSTYLSVQGVDVGQDSGVRFAPFKVICRHSGLGIPDSTCLWLLPKFLLSILFPMTVAATFLLQVRRDARLHLAWLQFAVGAFFSYFIAEHPNYSPGNFIWSGHITLFVLYFVSVLVLVEQTRTKPLSSWSFLADRRYVLCSLVFLVHVVSGVALFLNPTVR